MWKPPTTSFTCHTHISGSGCGESLGERMRVKNGMLLPVYHATVMSNDDYNYVPSSCDYAHKSKCKVQEQVGMLRKGSGTWVTYDHVTELDTWIFRSALCKGLKLSTRFTIP